VASRRNRKPPLKLKPYIARLLRRLDLEPPPAGMRIPVSAVDKELKRLQLPAEERFLVKSELAEAKIIN
jgi:hypothetical protein